MNAFDRFAIKTRRAELLLQPPIDLATVERFESEAGITIPEDYRDFLMHIANGAENHAAALCR